MEENGKSGGTKWIVIVLLLALIAGAGFWYLKGRKDAATGFATARVVRTNITQTVSATGTLKPLVNVEVGSQISGIIQKINVDFNSQVKAGDVIAQLDPATYKANVASAEGELANAQAGLELARINAQRAAELFKDKLISQSEFDQSNASLHQAEAQVKIRTATLNRAQVDLGRCTIYAPVDGTVIDRKVDVGQTVAASLSAPVLFQIANDLTKMQINVSVSEMDVGNVQVGQNVDFNVDAFQFRKFNGKVTQVRNAPIIVQNVVTYDTIVEVNNDDLKLKPGMTATVDFIVAQRENVLALPNSALRFKLPDTMASKLGTNAPAETVSAPTAAAPQENRRGSGGGDGERRRGGGGGGERSGRARGEGRPPRTIYTVTTDPSTAKAEDLIPNRVKLGINDNSFTEVVDGLKEGDIVISSIVSATNSAPANNPFGMQGGFPRR